MEVASYLGQCQESCKLDETMQITEHNGKWKQDQVGWVSDPVAYELDAFRKDKYPDSSENADVKACPWWPCLGRSIDESKY